MIWLQRLASPLLALAFFPLMAAAALAAAHQVAAPTWLALPPFVLLGINLGAAITIRPRFRADAWLLVFHLALLAVVLLLAVARLTYFEGQTPITRGTAFDGYVQRNSAGPLHGDRFRRLQFANAGFVERATDGPDAGGILNRVRWRDSSGEDAAWREAVIADDRPLVLDGYRIYPSGAKGLAPVLAWEPDAGELQVGTLQLPSSLGSDFQRGAEWRIDHGPELWAWINADPGFPKSDREDLGVRDLDHFLVVRHGEGRFALRPGDTAALAGGRLHYLRLESWLGYHVIYDPTRSWLAAAIVVAVVSLVGYYGRRLGRQAAAGSLE